MYRCDQQKGPTLLQLQRRPWNCEVLRRAQCIIEEYDSGLCLIRITHADNEVMSCWYPSRQAANERSAVIETELVDTGWGTAAP
jgi:hypothetical protein